MADKAAPREPRQYVPEDPTEEEEVHEQPVLIDDETEALGELADLAAQLGRAKRESEHEAKAAGQIMNLIGRLTKEAQQRLFSRPEVRKLFDVSAEREHFSAGNASDPPGTIYYRALSAGGEKGAWSKKAWTWADMAKFEKKLIVTQKRETLIWQGLPLTVHPRRENWVPEPFYGIWMDSQIQTETAEQHSAYMFGKGPPPRDTTVIASGTANVRATTRGHSGDKNIHVPGGGFTAVDVTPEPTPA